MSVQETNFDDILEFYFRGTDAHVANVFLLQAIEKQDSSWLQRVLRDHRIEGNAFKRNVIDYKDLKFREKVDDLIVCYCVLECAIRGAIIDAPNLAHPFWGDAKRVLGNEFVYFYYRDYYPERLAAFLKLRLEGRYSLVCDSISASKMLSFLELDRQFIINHRNGYFLHLLDDYVYSDEIRFDTLVEVIGSPEQFIESCLREEDGAGIIDSAIREFGLFLQHCSSLNSQLEAMAEWPDVRSAMALRYSTWFEILGEKLEASLGKALDQFLKWAPPPGAPNATNEIKLFVSEARTVLKQLVLLPYWDQADKELKSLER